jgi:hypothetical protein
VRRNDISELIGRDWQREEFFPRDAIVHLEDGSTQEDPGGWDHEHCQMCWREISQIGDADRFGYADEDDRWLCESCYIKHVAPTQVPGNN